MRTAGVCCFDSTREPKKEESGGVGFGGFGWVDYELTQVLPEVLATNVDVAKKEAEVDQE